MKRFPALLIVTMIAVVASLLSSPSQAVVSNHDVPKSYEVGRIFPGLTKTTRVLDETRGFEVPSAWCAGGKKFSAKSAMSVLYGPRYLGDFENWGSVSKPLLAISAYEFGTEKQAAAVIASLRAHSKKCKRYEADGMSASTGYLKIGKIGEERISMRIAFWGYGRGYVTYTGIRQGRVVSIVLTSADGKISRTRLTRLNKLAAASIH